MGIWFLDIRNSYIVVKTYDVLFRIYTSNFPNTYHDIPILKVWGEII